MRVLSSFLGVDKTLAQTQIVSEGFTVGTVTQSNSTNSADESSHNKVISQSPEFGSLIDYDSVVDITWRNFSFTPAPYSFTPAPTFSFTPAPTFSFTPAPTFSFTPAPVEKYFSYAYCQNGSLQGYSVMYLSLTGYSTVAEACAATQAQLAPYGISNWTCVEGTINGPLYTNMGVTCTPAGSGTIPNVVGLSLNLALAIISEEGFQNAPSQQYSSVGATASNDGKVKSQNPAAGTVSPFNTNVQLVIYNYTAPTFSFTPSTFSFTPATPFSFTPAPTFSFTPAPTFSFTPTTFNGCAGTKPYPYCVCLSNTPGTLWTC